MRDPFPMVSAPGADRLSLWIVDLERLSELQIHALASVIAVRCGVTTIEVVDEAVATGGFGMSSEWVERIDVGPEGLQRTLELKEFFETTPEITQEAFTLFLDSQYLRWVDGDEVPPPVPTSIDEVPEELRTPELEQAIRQNRITQVLATGGYSVMDVLSGRAMADVMNALETDPDVSWSLAGDDEDEDY